MLFWCAWWAATSCHPRASALTHAGLCPVHDALRHVCSFQVALGPTLDTIHMLCSAFGDVAKMTMFEKGGGLQVGSDL